MKTPIKPQIIVYTIGLLGVITSCNQVNQITNRKPHLELIESTPLQLNISDFKWGYGLTGFNQFSGDFEILDRRTFNLLKGKQGICKVYVEDGSTDKHGNISHDLTDFGELNVEELNKYSDWEYWHKDAGLRKLFYTHFNPTPKSDSVGMAMP